MTTTYRFEWSQLVPDGLVDRLAAIAGEAAGDRDEVRGLLARILEGVGGTPVANGDWEADHRSRVADLLLGEAVRAVLKHRFGFQGPVPGVITRDARGGAEAVGVDRIDVNRASRDRLVAALEEVVLYVAAHPHPCTHLDRKRDDLEPRDAGLGAAATARASRVRVLTDGSYYRHLIGLLEGVRERVDVCLFYIALPQPGHPTQKLLDALARKADAGCKVRVLVDQDGKDDPYRSHLINAAAVAFLSSSGVEVKGDPTERLLHSKSVVIDESVVVIGSHNWTAGSFFHYADASVAISGAQACRLWRTRFDGLWSQVEAFCLAEPGAEPS
jgi:hypothetical protein